MTPKPIFIGLFVASLLASTVMTGQACQYCRMAATDPEAARMAAQIHSGGFPLDATINQFQGITPPAILAAPPAPDSVVTNAADLPVSPARLHPPAAPVAVAATRVVAPTITPETPVTSARWSNAGLLGLMAAGGLFCWRTRRGFPPVS